MNLRSTLIAGALLAVSAVTAFPVQASPTAAALEPKSLQRAQTIRAQLDARYRVRPGRGLVVTEATSTGVVESFALLTPDLLETRLVPADNGIYYAICPVGATCPYPARRFARPAADFVPRRLALELALHTFLETSADVVAVWLPTPSIHRVRRGTVRALRAKSTCRLWRRRSAATPLASSPHRWRGSSTG